MKKILLLITLISFAIIQAQIVDIPDANFKFALLLSSGNQIAKDINGNWITIDLNNDDEIQENEAENVYFLDVSARNIATLTGIESFINLNNLNCSLNSLLSLPVNNLLNLEKLNCFHNDLASININNNIFLTEFNCEENNLTEININYNTNLTLLNCKTNNISNIDVSNNLSLISFSFWQNNLSSINLNNNIALTSLSCGSNNLTNLDISNNVNLTILQCGNENLTSLNVSNNLELTFLSCTNSNITNINVDNNTNLITLNLFNNNLSSLQTNNNLNLTFLGCANNSNILSLDLSNNNLLNDLRCQNILNLEYINLKNGNNIILSSSNFQNLPNLQYVCVDDVNSELVIDINTDVGHSVNYTEYCNQINGDVKLDINNDGCDSSDASISNLMIVSNNGTDNFATFTQNNGDYLLYTNEGNFTTGIATNLPNYYSANPNTQTNTFTGFDNIFTADFCIEPNQIANDVNISLIPTSQARPGFNATYKIVYKNVGTTQLSGNVTLVFDDTKLNFLNANETVNTQTSNSLTFNYSNLNPFETRTIDLEFNVFAPPTVNIDDILNFTSSINPITSDFTADDNIFTFNQTVIGSFDPNDITVLEGNQILLADVNKYLHYVIRFQNTGTASAINVVVTNDLDTNLDWSTLQLESLSHTNRVAIKNGNEIEFIFENINLPDSTTDEPNSHGFIAYKIKPKTDIALGDIIPNKADIFFDFNETIETNIETTTIVNALAVNDNTLLDFSVYPTPTENILNIKSKTEIVKIEIYSKLGQLIIKSKTENQIDVSNLTQGLYFVKVEDINGNFNVKKIVKR